MKTIKPLKIWSNDPAIAQGIAAADNTLPYAQDVYDAWTSIPGLPEFTADTYNLSCMDHVTLASDATIEYYKANYAPLHQPLGFSQEKGMEMVHENLPDFKNFLAKVEQLRTLGHQNNGYNPNIAPPEAFTVKDGAMIVNPDYITTFRAGNELYLNSKTEFAVKEVLDNLVSSLQSLGEVIPPSVFRLHNNGYGSIDLNLLHELVKVTSPHNQAGLNIEVNTPFYFKLHAAVVSQQLP